MKAMLLKRIVDLAKNQTPLEMAEVPRPRPGPGEVLLKVSTCGVCHTELDEIEGRTPPPILPMILGHQIVGRVVEAGSDAERHQPGDRLGVGWIFNSCGQCAFCQEGRENLCAKFTATGRDAPGGYAEYVAVPQNFAFPIPETFSDAEAAPLLCAGAIGYRSLRLAGLVDGQSLGLTGFGASAHLVLKMVRHKFPQSPVFVFARSPSEREFAKSLGAAWAGDTAERAPGKLNAIIDTTPVWRPIVQALANLAPGGRLVVNAIRKEELDKDELLGLSYPEHLWMEKEVVSVANVAKRDIAEFLELAARIPLKPEYQLYSLQEANQALLELKNKRIKGAKVLKIG